MSAAHCTPRGVNFEAQTDTFTVGESSLTFNLAGQHKRVPMVTVICENSTNANYNMFVSSVSKTQVIVEISAAAPANLVAHIKAISTL